MKVKVPIDKILHWIVYWQSNISVVSEKKVLSICLYNSPEQLTFI